MMGIVAGTKRVVVRILTIIGLIVVSALGIWGTCGLQYKRTTQAPSSTPTVAATQTVGTTGTTYVNTTQHFRFMSSQPLRLVRTYTVKGSGVGNWWHAQYAVREDQLAGGERSPFFEVAVLTTPFAVPATGKYGPSYQSKTKLEIELYTLSKADPTAVCSEPTGVDIGGAKGWTVVVQHQQDGVTMKSLIAYTVRQTRWYRLEFMTPVADWDTWGNLCDGLFASFRLD